MPFLVSAKGRRIRLRDMGREGHPMIEFGADPVVFLRLPGRYETDGSDKDVEVVRLADLDGFAVPQTADVSGGDVVAADPEKDIVPPKRRRSRG